jgi:hypothetical protein
MIIIIRRRTMCALPLKKLRISMLHVKTIHYPIFLWGGVLLGVLVWENLDKNVKKITGLIAN